jgi:DNA polymerase-3 subunit alpha
MAHIDVPQNETEETFLRKKVYKGLNNRYKVVNDEIKKRADYELEIIVNKGYAGYYLVVADFIEWSKNNGIRIGPGRGSGAGSICAFALGITELDPLAHGLIFERFLNPERPSMPDFDIDVETRNRGRVIKYVEEKYGYDKVSQIVTFNYLKAKQAIQDSARILGFEVKDGQKLSDMMPKAINGVTSTFNDVFNKSSSRFKESADLRQEYSSNEDSKKIIDTARGIEGIMRGSGVHAAGVVMSSEKLEDIVPLMARTADNTILTQFEYHDLEDLGLVKMDFLGLRNLSIFNDTLENIKLQNKTLPVLEKLPLDDKKTFELLRSGDTNGIFQLEQVHVQHLLKQLKPTEFNDITAINALNRPGPMGMDSHTKYANRKNGLEKITPIHPELKDALEPILKETYGLIVYQEQVMRIARVIASYTLAEADSFRKAMGKKNADVLASEKERFTAGALKNKYSKPAIEELWQVLLPFSAYAFNKSHSASYSLIGYWTAYLKAHFKNEFFAALLTSVQDDPKKLPLYLAEIKNQKIKILPPDINQSYANFICVSSSTIRFGLQAIKGVGKSIVVDIIAEREKNGEFKSFHNFIRRNSARVTNKGVLEALIKAGAFDSFKHTKSALISSFEAIISSYSKDKDNAKIGQASLFDTSASDDIRKMIEVKIPDTIPEYDNNIIMEFEKTLLGNYVSKHPLDPYKERIEKLSNINIFDLYPAEVGLDSENNDNSSLYNQKNVQIAGIINKINERMSRAGNKFYTLEIEDFTGTIECIIFTKRDREIKFALPKTGDIVVLNGKVDSSIRSGTGTIVTQVLVKDIKDIRDDSIIQKKNLPKQSALNSKNTLNNKVINEQTISSPNNEYKQKEIITADFSSNDIIDKWTNIQNIIANNKGEHILELNVNEKGHIHKITIPGVSLDIKSYINNTLIS